MNDYHRQSVEPQISDERHRIVMSHSLWNTLNSCPRRFEFTVLWNRTVLSEQAFAAEVGTALHECLQEYLRQKAEGYPRAESMVKGYLALLRYYPFKASHLQSTKTRDLGSTLLLAELMMKDPLWEEEEVIQLENKDWSIEIPFLINYPNLSFTSKNGEEFDFLFQGKIDLVTRNKTTGKVTVFDIKTTSLKKDSLEYAFTHSGQQVGYNQIVQKMLGIKKDSFTVRYAVYLFTSLGPDKELIEIEKTSEALNDYRENLRDIFTRLAGYIKVGFFPRINSGCMLWNRPCGYFPVCHRRDEKFISAWFAENGKPWNRIYKHAVIVSDAMQYSEGFAI